MDLPFRVAGGTVPGSAHVRAGRSSQDAFAWAWAPRGLVAVVCDGCGSAPRSEIGAGLAARLFAASAARAMAEGERAADVVCERAIAATLGHLHALGRAMSLDTAGTDVRAVTTFARTVHDAFLFTVVVLVVQPEETVVFAAGDGVVVVNGERIVLGPFEDNAPPYPGYALVDPTRPSALEVVRRLPTEKLASLVLGTDGAIDVAADRSFDPARDPRILANPDMVRRRLAVLARSESTRFEDDATLVVIGRVADPALAFAADGGGPAHEGVCS